MELARGLVNQVVIQSRRHQRAPYLSLGKVVRDVLPLIRAAIPNTALLRVAVDTHAPSVHADPIAMQRVLLNLVLNAARAIRQLGHND